MPKKIEWDAKGMCLTHLNAPYGCPESCWGNGWRATSYFAPSDTPNVVRVFNSREAAEAFNQAQIAGHDRMPAATAARWTYRVDPPADQDG